MIHEFLLRSPIPASAATVFAWHMRRGAFERLAPPWAAPIVDSPFSPPGVGQTVELQVPVLPGVRFRWISEFTEFVEDRLFRDRQVTGPFDSFDHSHSFEPVSDREMVMEDRIAYAPLGGRLGDSLGGAVARKRLEAIFKYRHRLLARDIAVHASGDGRSLRVLVTGASGLVGSALSAFLSSGGHEVHHLTRRPARDPREIQFDPDKGAAHPSEMEGFDAVVHLAGEPIAEGRWTAEKKARIRDSRVRFTRRLAETLGALKRPPRVLVSASAAGYYGDRGDRVLREADPPGEGFLSEVCMEWEGATDPAAQAGIRVACLRTGLVLSPAGGALAPMLPPFSLGLGGPVGRGEQWWSFIALDDLLYLIHFALTNEKVRGPLNATSPESVTNREFAATLGRVLHRPAVIPVPRKALDLVLGPMSGPLLFASARINPEKAVDLGFRFAYPNLEAALRHELGRVIS